MRGVTCQMMAAVSNANTIANPAHACVHEFRSPARVCELAELRGSPAGKASAIAYTGFTLGTGEAEPGDPGSSQPLSQEQDFRCYGCSGTGHDVQELQSIAQQFPKDSKDGAEVTLPNASKWQHGRSASHKARMPNRVLWNNRRKKLEPAPGVKQIAACIGSCGPQRITYN